MSGVRIWVAAAVVTVAAFLLYDATLLPGQDLGDTASFEATVGSSYLSPREAYPLYYATGNLFVWAMGGETARAINLASAVFAALACGLLVVSLTRLAGSLTAGLTGSLMLASSYTFWSQAIIAEVYALHCFMMAACLLALVFWTERPTLGRLAVFFALYAAGFGNHLMMVLLLPGFTLYLLLAAPGGPRWIVRPRVVALAAVLAALGASQYLWNFSPLLHLPGPPHGPFDLLSRFWFDVTKSDWRATMVMGIPEGTLRDRTAMWWFDLRQQFGVVGVALALVGVAATLVPGPLPGRLARVTRPRVGLSLLVLFAVCWFFAFTYNVGDTHVFYIPAHFLAAVFAGLGAGALVALARKLEWGPPRSRGAEATLGSLAAATALPTLVAVLLVAVPVWRAYDTYPALDRSRDWQVKEFYDRLTSGLTGLNSVFASDLNWQLHNGLDYYAKYTKPDLAVADTPEALLYFPFLVKDNREIARPIAATSGARSLLADAYGPLFDIEPDPRVLAPPLADRLADLRPGTAYVLTLLSQYPDNPIDKEDLAHAVAFMTGGTTRLQPTARYNVMIGRVGQAPALVRSSARPFRLRATAGNVEVDVRIECWLPADTIRRMGFGRVVAGRRPVLTLDRGVSVVALNDDGTARRVEYGWAILAPQARWLIPLRAKVKE
ncbi:MAG: protein O-mannosyl-transferase family [Bacteroidales bacterium]